MKVKVYVFRGERDVNDENWGNFIDYEDTPKVYERYAREGENPRLDKPIVNEEMVSDDGIHQKWVKTIVVCCK